MGPTLLRPKSRGTVTLQSQNPKDQAIIDPNFLAEQDDVDFFLRGTLYRQKYDVPFDFNSFFRFKAINWCLKVAETNAMKNIGTKFFDKVSILIHLN